MPVIMGLVTVMGDVVMVTVGMQMRSAIAMIMAVKVHSLTVHAYEDMQAEKQQHDTDTEFQGSSISVG